MTTLYQLSGMYSQLLDKIEDIDDVTFNDTLDAINDSIEDKAENYGRLIKQLEHDSESLSKESERLKKRSDSLKRKAMSFKLKLRDSMIMTNKKRISTEHFNFTVRKNAASVVIANDAKIPNDLMNIKETKSPNKKAIKKAIESGQEIDGVKLVTNESLLIK